MNIFPDLEGSKILVIHNGVNNIFLSGSLKKHKNNFFFSAARFVPKKGVDILFNIDWEFLGAFSAIALIGILIGITLSQHIKTNLLKKGFGLFITGMGIIILIFEFILWL